MSAPDPSIERHREWLGFVQPVGLVFAPYVLANRQVGLELRPKEIEPWRDRLAGLLDEEGRACEPLAVFREVLEWPETALVEPPVELDRHLRELEVTLRADRAVPAARGEPAGWLALVKVEEDDAAIDRPWQDAPDGWHASPHARFERLLRETGIAIGFLVTPRRLRLLYVPRGETSGHLDFVFAHMLGVAGRPILAAMRALLGHAHVRAGPPERRLSSLLRESRERQAEVSETLGRQVQEALGILLDGFVAAARRADPEHGVATLAARDELYEALVTVMMRLVFLLYAEERGLVPAGPVYEQSYSVGGLFARRGALFDPERFPILEGRAPPFSGTPPTVSDGHVHRMLEKLLVLNGERLSYRTLDVEEIGSVYQQIMGLVVERSGRDAVAIRPAKKGGAPAFVSLAELLAEPTAQRNKAFREKTGHDLPREARDAGTVDELTERLGRLVVRALTPRPLPAGVPVLQPTDERRRTGSHYTPRSLTEPIVAEALRPILERLGPEATPEQILDLAILDPAMGSGAFLVEACRQLAARLVEAWARHRRTPTIPADEDELLYAKRLVATRCLYGVDKNPLTVELAKLSLWLETLAKDHELTFLDHALRAGDSLVGLDLGQLEGIDFDRARAERNRSGLLHGLVRERLAGLASDRAAVEALAEELGEVELSDLLRRGEAKVADLARLGDAIVAAFFAHATPEERERALGRIRELVEGPRGQGWHERLDVAAARPLRPLHWPLLFPEVFTRENPGFDAIVGNPPFGGHVSVAAENVKGYSDWLRETFDFISGKVDLSAYFFRRAFYLIRECGTFGLLATNTIRQGDTRSSGLRVIRSENGVIYSATRRYKWPGEAAVVVSVVHVHKGPLSGPCRLDGREVERITAFLFDKGGDEDPAKLAANAGKSFQGSIVLGMGFTFDDTDRRGVANPVSVMRELIAKDPRNAERIFPYIGGEELNDDPEQRPHRWVINFGNLSEGEARAGWPDLMRIVEEKVRPERLRSSGRSVSQHGNRALIWWQHYHLARQLYQTIRNLPRVLAIARVGQHGAFAFLPNGMVYSEQLVVFALPTDAAFCALQARPHEVWARFLASTLGDGLRYTPQDCFETFPFPENFETDSALEAAGKAYDDHRARIMRARQEGLTETYNRFHDPTCRDADIEELRRLHRAMDAAVLRAYGWEDLVEKAVPVFLKDGNEDDHAWRGRLAWPAAVREEVLARLLDLNAERARAEAAAGATRPNRRRRA
ncbi:MAG: hypothetical protein KatS3mg117_0829 [Geminicoccaceae bacterium]|nr:MAG: hypothetical protein KatS3mg117_0829 [Geminicoccaceae bacterium]